VVCHDIVFVDGQLKIEDIKEFAFDPADVTFAEDACAHSPVHVLQR
jgi:hypothetical protein